MEQSKNLLTQLLFGLESATEEALQGLEASVQEIYEKAQNLNDKKIQLKCSEVQRRVEVRQYAFIHLVPRLALYFSYFFAYKIHMGRRLCIYSYRHITPLNFYLPVLSMRTCSTDNKCVCVYMYIYTQMLMNKMHNPI